MFGARTGGLRETESIAFEMGECFLPPDSEAGSENEKRIDSELRERYFKLPPSKRVNYVKLGINSPFICPWKLLLKDWAGQNVDSFYVLRDWRLLEELQVIYSNLFLLLCFVLYFVNFSLIRINHLIYSAYFLTTFIKKS